MSKQLSDYVKCEKCFKLKTKKSFLRNGTKVKSTICKSCLNTARCNKGIISKEEAIRQHSIMIENGTVATCKYCLVEKSAEYFYTKRDYGKLYLNTTKCKDCQLEDLRFRTFGITNLEYNFILELQDYKCAICKISIEDYSKIGYRNNFAVDHCHSTGKVRGLLCDLCNRGLGLFKDNPENLKNAIKYISS